MPDSATPGSETTTTASNTNDTTGADAAAQAAAAAAAANAGGGGDAAAQAVAKAAADAAAAAGADTAKAAADKAAADKATADAAAAAQKPDWRKEIAGDDAKLLTRLNRYADVKSLGSALISLQNELSSGKYKRQDPPKDATAEQLTAWRTENGLPTEAKGYLEGDHMKGLVIADDDRPIFESFAADLHKINADPKVVAQAVSWYNNMQQEQVAALAKADVANATATTDLLKKEWDVDYEANTAMRANLLNAAPPEVAEALKSARLSDGTLLGEHPEVSRWLVNMARDINPVASVMPNGQGPAAIDTEILTIKALMAKPGSEYWKGPKAEPMQARYRQLIDAQSKLKTRAAA